MQFPAFMTQYPWSTKVIPTSYLLPAQWPQPHSDELLLAMEESDFEDKVISLYLFLYIYVIIYVYLTVLNLFHYTYGYVSDCINCNLCICF